MKTSMRELDPHVKLYEAARSALLGYEHDTEALWRVVVAADNLVKLLPS